MYPGRGIGIEQKFHYRAFLHRPLLSFGNATGNEYCSIQYHGAIISRVVKAGDIWHWCSVRRKECTAKWYNYCILYVQTCFQRAVFQNRNLEDARYQVLQLASLCNVQASRSQEKEHARGHSMISVLQCFEAPTHLAFYNKMLKNLCYYCPLPFSLFNFIAKLWCWFAIHLLLQYFQIHHALICCCRWRVKGNEQCTFCAY